MRRYTLLLLLVCFPFCFPGVSFPQISGSGGVTPSHPGGGGGGGGTGVQDCPQESGKFLSALNGSTGGCTKTIPTKADVGLDQVDNTSDTTKNSATAILTNKQYVPRIVQCTPSSNTITPNADTTDVCYYYSLAATTTIANPTASGSNPVDQQRLEITLKSAAPQALVWDTKYNTECGIPLPTGTTGDGATYNHFLFRYSATSTKWCILSTTQNNQAIITTLASSSTFTCPSDSSDICEMQMTGGAGTLTVAAPTGSPVNGKTLSLRFLCTNAQTFSWNAAFKADPVLSLPSTCPADLTKWTTVEVFYSTVLSKWQLRKGEATGSANAVLNNQGNTYSTGAQDLGSATSLIVPKAGGAAPTADADVRFDTTQHQLVVGENGLATNSVTRVKCQGDGGSSNDAGSGTTEVDHTPKCTIPANYWLNHRALRFTVILTITTTASPPTYTFKIKAGSTTLYTHTNETPSANRTNLTIAASWILASESAPGASANIRTAVLTALDAFCCTDNMNLTAQPVAVATNASKDITFTSKWNTATSGNIFVLSTAFVEVIN